MVVLDQAAVERVWENRSKEGPGVTCVAFFHHRRPRECTALIDRIQDFLRRRLAGWIESDWVRLAHVDQIHATLIGIEATRACGVLINKNWSRIQAEHQDRPMDLDGFAEYLRRVELPVRLRFGSFSPSAVNPYDPRPPYERSFTIGRDGLIVVIGWPMVGDIFRPALLDFRKGAESFHIVHKYHKNQTDRDNDLFMVLGTVTPYPWEGRDRPPPGFENFAVALSEVQEEIREFLRALPVDVELRTEHCCMVKYRTADLAGVPEQDVLPWVAVTAESLRRLYA
jgi:hypothetical protein